MSSLLASIVSSGARATSTRLPSLTSTLSRGFAPMFSRGFAHKTHSLRPVYDLYSKGNRKPLFTPKFVRQMQSESSENSKILKEVQRLMATQSNELSALRNEQALVSSQLKLFQESSLSKNDLFGIERNMTSARTKTLYKTTLAVFTSTAGLTMGYVLAKQGLVNF